MMATDFSLFPDDSYRYHSGCVEGRECTDGTYCGAYISSDECATGCSFEECLALAKERSSYGFGYRSTGGRWCRMCDQSAVSSSTNYMDWGIYTIIGKLFCLTFCSFDRIYLFSNFASIKYKNIGIILQALV